MVVIMILKKNMGSDMMFHLVFSLSMDVWEVMIWANYNDRRGFTPVGPLTLCTEEKGKL